ncbi:hypothetical protein V6617_10000 [Pelagibacterium nitratireducens]|uniref:Uncharacterized protein n=1 Tax=Pelagibacterium nitratireducens TaxID=1046114 RepID=A0ABZ2HUN9_9HYPH
MTNDDMTIDARLAAAIDQALEYYGLFIAGLDEGLDPEEEDYSGPDMRLDGFVEQASLARLYSLYLDQAGWAAGADLRDEFRRAQGGTVGKFSSAEFAFGYYRIGNERFDITAIAEALRTLNAALDRPGTD